MPDSEELDEILKEIKNINAPKEKPEPKEEQPLTLADDKPAKEEAEAKPKPVKENVNFNDFSSFNSAQHSDIPKDNKGEKKMPKKKGTYYIRISKLTKKTNGTYEIGYY